MSEQHSPVPWKTRSVGKAIDVVAADGRYVATLASRPESAADARLIAAAPAMLELLRGSEKRGSGGRCPWCVRWVDDEGHEDDCGLVAVFARIDGKETP